MAQHLPPGSWPCGSHFLGWSLRSLDVRTTAVARAVTGRMRSAGVRATVSRAVDGSEGQGTAALLLLPGLRVPSSRAAIEVLIVDEVLVVVLWARLGEIDDVVARGAAPDARTAATTRARASAVCTVRAWMRRVHPSLPPAIGSRGPKCAHRLRRGRGAREVHHLVRLTFLRAPPGDSSVVRRLVGSVALRQGNHARAPTRHRLCRAPALSARSLRMLPRLLWRCRLRRLLLPWLLPPAAAARVAKPLSLGHLGQCGLRAVGVAAGIARIAQQQHVLVVREAAHLAADLALRLLDLERVVLWPASLLEAIGRIIRAAPVLLLRVLQWEAAGGCDAVRFAMAGLSRAGGCRWRKQILCICSMSAD